MTRFTWIMYVSQNLPGTQVLDLHRVSSLDEARNVYKEHCDAVGTDNCSASLYAYSPEAWKLAKEFRNSGCPFDYPVRVIERGPSGGITIVNA